MLLEGCLFQRTGLAELNYQGFTDYLTLAKRRQLIEHDDPMRAAAAQRLATSGEYLATHLEEVPVLVVPCLTERLPAGPACDVAAGWADMMMPAWSFMLAARERALGTCWTTLHLAWEREAAALLGIQYDSVMQAGLIALDYTIGTTFTLARRKPVTAVLHGDR